MGGDKFRDEFSLAFDGIDDHIRIPSTTYNIHNSTHSFVFWVKRNSITSWDVLLGSAAGAHNFILFDTDGGDRLIIEGDDDDNAIGACSVVAGRWHHMVIVTNGDGTVAMYQDGVSISVSYDDGSIGSDMTVDSIGGNHAVLCLSGNIFEIAIYNSALSASQVKTLYNGREPYNHKEGIATGNLTAWYRMGDGVHDKRIDNVVTNEVDISVGADIVVNGDFATGDFTGWTSQGGDISVAGGGVKFVCPADGSNVYLVSPTAVEGAAYEITYDVLDVSSTGTHSLVFQGATTPGNIDIPGTLTGDSPSTNNKITWFATTTSIAIKRGGNDIDVTLDNISMKKLGDNTGIKTNMDSNSITGDTP
tara:strand:- start:1112 stop:2197 length:1086 start_codon:yes stop_codon:yes gene_type:complete